MKPDLVTAPALRDVLEELRKREAIFHRPEFGRTRQDFEQMIAASFERAGKVGSLKKPVRQNPIRA